MTHSNGNGFTQKELLKLVIERLDRLEEKLDNKLDKAEFYKVLGLVATVILIVGSLSMQVIMKATVNLSQVLQGGLAALVGWLFKTVNDLQQEVTALQVEIVNSNSKLSDVLNIIQGIDSEITEIIWKIGG